MSAGAILSFLTSAVKPITDLIDNLNTSDEERGLIRLEFMKLQAGLFAQVFQYEEKLLSSRASIIEAEAKGQSWLQRTWRPITMLTFLVLVVADSFGWLANPLAPQMWTLMQIGLGGYVVGRSAEKIAPSIAKAISERQIAGG